MVIMDSFRRIILPGFFGSGSTPWREQNEVKCWGLVENDHQKLRSRSINTPARIGPWVRACPVSANQIHQPRTMGLPRSNNDKEAKIALRPTVSSPTSDPSCSIWIGAYAHGFGSRLLQGVWNNHRVKKRLEEYIKTRQNNYITA